MPRKVYPNEAKWKAKAEVHRKKMREAKAEYESQKAMWQDCLVSAKGCNRAKL